MSSTMYVVLISSLSTGTIITMSSHHWLLAWLGLEINTLAMIPIITKPHHPRATEAATKYFLTQAAAAALILFASTTNAWQTGQWTIMQPMGPLPTLMLVLAIAMKLGIAPAHLWLPDVIQGSTMTTALIMSTWQKLAPLALLYYTTNHLPPNIMLMLGLTSALLGSWTGLNQTQTRKIMAFSSIAHMGWLTTTFALSQSLTTLTLLTYLTLTTTTFITLTMTSTKTITDMGTSWSYSPTLLTLMMMTLMSLGGLPPLTGFTPKWLIIKELTQHQLVVMATTLALTSLPSLFFYMRMAYFTTLTTPPQTTHTQHKWRFKTNLPKPLPTTLITTLLTLPLTPMIYTTI
uniref:NADH-ubiquinone oxidoreductase chain 2 n=1 Tax=Saurodactylus fasciatus TaxID=456484 RepID=J7G4Z9_9SAUR|nr:NADH dehydrogenase subunit 2 [Saurodactylus fasciatus]